MDTDLMGTDRRPTPTADRFAPPAPPTVPFTTAPPAAQPIDPLMQDRLARLASRRETAQPARLPAAGDRIAPSPGRPRRRHAARGSRAAAVALSIGTTAGLAGYFQQVDAASSDAATSASATAVTTATAPTAATTGSAADTQILATSTAAAATDAAANDATAAATSTGLADGTYTGATDTNKWGPVQVEITVSGGVITEVVALQTPDDDHKSVSINERAVPTLVSETLASQSADIDTVSGATYTTDSYKVSLQSAIDLARSTALAAGASA